MQLSSDIELSFRDDTPDFGEPSGPTAPGESNSEEDALRAILAAACGGILGRDGVGVHDDLFELGIDSILAIQLISRVNQLFRTELPAACLFEAPTVEQLAQYMISHEARPGITEVTAKLLKQIENMSDEEVNRSLHAKDEPKQSIHE